MSGLVDERKLVRGRASTPTPTPANHLSTKRAPHRAESRLEGSLERSARVRASKREDCGGRKPTPRTGTGTGTRRRRRRTKRRRRSLGERNERATERQRTGDDEREPLVLVGGALDLHAVLGGEARARRLRLARRAAPLLRRDAQHAARVARVHRQSRRLRQRRHQRRRARRRGRRLVQRGRRARRQLLVDALSRLALEVELRDARALLDFHVAWA